MTDKHTPGPWQWWTSCSFNRLSSLATGKDGGVLHAVQYRDGVCGIEGSEADMRLIASSPRLLSAAKRVTAAFRAIGQPASVAGLLSKLREECEASMLELDEAIKEANGDTP